MVKEEARMAYAKRRDAFCFVRFMLEEMSAPALSICAKVKKKTTLQLQALVDVHPCE